MTAHRKWLLLVIACVRAAHAFYTEEPVLKLLTVESTSDRYPVSDSEYRVSLTQGHDEDAEITQDEDLNGFQPLKLVLDAGGCASYVFPAQKNQTYVFIVPAKNDEDNPFEVFCNKGIIDITVTSEDLQRTNAFTCFDDGACTAEPCSGDLTGIHSGISGEESFTFDICTQTTSPYSAFIWELDISSSYLPTKVLGQYHEDGRTRIDSTQTVPDFNTQLSMVSVVGMRGVGKSTIISLLSGNDTMFENGAASVGTTTIGADISPIMPAVDWTQTLSTQIERQLTQPASNLPLFFIDSEGMGVRPGDFDFMTTSSPAIISKQILWVDEAPVDTTNILNSIGNYLDGLDGITFSDDGGGNGVYCPSALYGHFIIIINKLNDDTSDEQLENTILTPVPGETDLNVIRQRIYECFESARVVGCPRETVPEGESFGYGIISDRFKDELAIISDSIIGILDTPRIVSINDMALPFNSTDASKILDFIIAQANEGTVDLTKNPILLAAEQDVVAYLDQMESDLAVLFADNCEKLNQDFTCSACACPYRNIEIQSAVDHSMAILEQANVDSMDIFGEDISPEIAQFQNETVEPWKLKNWCYQHRPNGQWSAGQHMCDLTEMDQSLNAPGQDLVFTCIELMLCDAPSFDANSLTIQATKVFISADGVNLQHVLPSNGGRGSDGVNPGENGGTGSPGASGPAVSIDAAELLPGSTTAVTMTSQGGNGGDGGNGVDGVDNMSTIPPGPANAYSVVQEGTQTGHWHDCDNHCGLEDCDVCKDKYYYEVHIDTNACGGKGGDAGNGGDGGVPGTLTLTGAAGLTGTVEPLSSIGGQPGTAGLGRAGLDAHRIYYGTEYRYETNLDCDGMFHGCDTDWATEYIEYSYVNNDVTCNGANGNPGTPGTSN